MSPPLRVAALLPWLLGAALPDPCDRMALVTAVLEATLTVDAAEEAARAALSDASAPAGPDPDTLPPPGVGPYGGRGGGQGS